MKPIVPEVGEVVAALSKVVILEIETTSKALTPAEFQQSLARLETASVKIKIKQYSGFGGTSFYFTETASGITSQVISVFNGTHGYAAAVESTKLSQAKLGQLTKLASTL